MKKSLLLGQICEDSDRNGYQSIALEEFYNFVIYHVVIK